MFYKKQKIKPKKAYPKIVLYLERLPEPSEEEKEYLLKKYYRAFIDKQSHSFVSEPPENLKKLAKQKAKETLQHVINNSVQIRKVVFNNKEEEIKIRQEISSQDNFIKWEEE